jgi:hypothetical protein
MQVAEVMGPGSTGSGSTGWHPKTSECLPHIPSRHLWRQELLMKCDHTNVMPPPWLAVGQAVLGPFHFDTAAGEAPRRPQSSRFARPGTLATPGAPVTCDVLAARSRVFVHMDTR